MISLPWRLVIGWNIIQHNCYSPAGDSLFTICTFHTISQGGHLIRLNHFRWNSWYDDKDYINIKPWPQIFPPITPHRISQKTPWYYLFIWIGICHIPTWLYTFTCCTGRIAATINKTSTLLHQPVHHVRIRTGWGLLTASLQNIDHSEIKLP